MKRMIAGVLASGLGVVALAGTAGAAAEKYELVGPGAVINCISKDPVTTDNTPLEGFAIFNHSADDGTLKVTVSVKDGEPNTEYPVRLIQGLADCHTVDGVLTTNAQGKGTLNVREPASATGTAQVILDTTTLHATPTYRATDTYVW